MSEKIKVQMAFTHERDGRLYALIKKELGNVKPRNRVNHLKQILAHALMTDGLHAHALQARSATAVDSPAVTSGQSGAHEGSVVGQSSLPDTRTNQPDTIAAADYQADAMFGHEITMNWRTKQ